MRERVAALFPGPNVDRITVSVLLVTTAVLLVSDYEGSTAFWNSTLRPHLGGQGPVYDVAPYYWWFGTSFVLYLVIPCLAALALRTHRLAELGFGLGDQRFGFALSGALIAVMVPVVLVASRTETFRAQYPMCGEALSDASLFAAYEVTYALYFVSWEFLFRGYMLQGLKAQLGGGLAILVQTVPFALMHSGKPEAEAYGSVVAGLALGALALRTGSFWYGAGIHAVIAVVMDLAAGLPRLK